MKLLKNKSYWLNGGIIFLILDILLIGFIIISSHPWEVVLLGLSMTQIPVSGLYLSFTGVSSALGLIPLIILGLINWFIIGSIIGWIIEKIKINK